MYIPLSKEPSLPIEPINTFFDNTVVKMETILGIEICEHGGSLEGKHLILLDHGNLDFKFERAIFEIFQFLTFFIK